MKDTSPLLIRVFYFSRVCKVLNDKTHNLINLKLDEKDKTIEMNNLRPIFTAIIISTSFLVIGCSSNFQRNRTPALFETKAEAEKATKDFNCTGTHKMGNKWMPCKSHANHEEAERHDSHNGLRHHH